VLQPRQPLAQAGDLALVELGRGHEQPRVAHLAARGDRLRAEGREQRRHHAAGLQRAQHRDVELGQPPHQHEDALARRHAQAAQRVGEAAGGGRQVGVAEVDALAALADPADRGAALARRAEVAVDRLVRDVQPAARQAGELRARLRPVEAAADRVVVGQVRRHAPPARLLDDARRNARRPVAGLRCLLGHSTVSRRLAWVRPTARRSAPECRPSRVRPPASSRLAASPI
jgi:hypothetical protein